MEETTNKSGMSTGMIIGIAVLVAIVSGGGAYAYVNSKAASEKKDLNAQITELQGQVSSATTATISTTAISSVTASATTAKSATASTSATSATSETANWKTYTNSAYGFSFKYPSDWYVHEGDNDNILTVTNLSTGGVNKGNTTAILKQEGKTAYEGIYFSNSEPSADNVIRMEDQTIAGKTIKLYYYNNSEAPGSTTVFAKRGLWTNTGGKKITVGTLTETGSETSEIAILDQILPTFQFTK